MLLAFSKSALSFCMSSAFFALVTAIVQSFFWAIFGLRSPLLTNFVTGLPARFLNFGDYKFWQFFYAFAAASTPEVSIETPGPMVEEI